MPSENQTTKLLRINKELSEKCAELEETLRAIQEGEVDALVVNGPSGKKIFSLQSTEQPYRELVESMNEGAITLSSDGTILYCNSKFDHMARGSHKKLVGSKLSTRIRLEDQAAFRMLLERSRTAPTSGEFHLVISEQISLPVQFSVSSISAAGSRGFCVVATDLSTQKQNTLVFQQQEWLGSLLNFLPVPLVLLDADLQSFKFINATAAEIIGEPNSRATATASISLPLSFEDENGELIEIRDLLLQIDSGARSQGVETVLATKRRKLPVLLFSENLPTMHDHEPYRLLMFHDISKMKQAQTALAESLLARDLFMNALTKELMSPINLTLGWVQLIRDHSDDEAVVRKALDTLEKKAQAQRELIVGLVEMSRIITGTLEFKKSVINLNDCVSECLKPLRTSTDEKQIDLQVHYNTEVAFVCADDLRIRQLVSKLVQNAIKLTPPEGRISILVDVENESQMAFISVLDSGPGISSFQIRSVLDQSTQDHLFKDRAYEGHTLRLAVCKAIIEQHGGTLHVTSAGIGYGAKFTACLPLVRPTSGRAPKALPKSRNLSARA